MFVVWRAMSMPSIREITGVAKQSEFDLSDQGCDQFGLQRKGLFCSQLLNRCDRGFAFSSGYSRHQDGGIGLYCQGRIKY